MRKGLDYRHIVCIADIRARIEEDIDISLNENSPEPELKIVIRDLSIATEHIVLEAESLGLGTCWVAYFNKRLSYRHVNFHIGANSLFSNFFTMHNVKGKIIC